ncbi:MAG TPA: Cys-tRNA(Pro) deacylase [Candidatus Borkfalkia excrementavium]|uniref:Cys-tRNA(Pro)/Cys-tRNA(Cys) deacylase n=1 Tax=Candidatus Borkfalkia excrementavium TaxID=2838505 RepID=A0A9D1Z7C1_9FIRM|nr:Cys-tRNA(Pro) deacylase [Candidatus Borkfalkia excrementavium]
MTKTNAMRLLDAKKIAYESFAYAPEITDGQKVAQLLGEDERRVFKTLVTVSDKGEHFVFCVPVCASLDLKSAARAAGVKSVSMIRQKELEPLTGYIHGGCSPVGMKKRFPTFIDESANDAEEIYVSAGRVGCQIRVSVSALAAFVGAKFAAIAEF